MLTEGTTSEQVSLEKNKTSRESAKKQLEENLVEYEKVKGGLFMFPYDYFLFQDYSSTNAAGISNENLLPCYSGYSLMPMDKNEKNEDLFNNLMHVCSVNTSDLTPSEKELNEELLSILNTSPSSDKEKGYAKTLEKFLEKNKSNQSLKNVLNFPRGESKLTVLHVLSSITWKNEEYFYAMHLLLKAEANPDVQDSEKRTPLHYAASVDSSDAIKLLLHNKAIPDIKDIQGKTPLDIANDKHYYHLQNYFLTSQQENLAKELFSNIAITNVYDSDRIVNLTRNLKKFLDKNRSNQDLKTVLSLRGEGGELKVLNYIIKNTFCSLSSPGVNKEVKNSFKLELERLISEIKAASQELPYEREECLFKSLWSKLTPNQRKIQDEFLRQVCTAQSMSQLESIIDEAINSGIRFNFPIQLDHEMMSESTYNFVDIIMTRIKKLEKDPKVISNVVCKLVSRGAVFYNEDSMNLISELESNFKDHKINMVKAYEDYVNRTLDFMEIVKSATTGEVKDAKVDNSTLYLEYSEDSTIHPAKVTGGARDLGLTQGETGYGRNVIKIGKSEVEIITANDIRYYTNLTDGSDIVLIFHTSLGKLEVRLYPDKQNKDLITVEVKDQEKWNKLKDCNEEIGKNCLLGRYAVCDAIEQGYFERLGKPHQSSEKITLLNEQKKGGWCERISMVPSSEQTTGRSVG